MNVRALLVLFPAAIAGFAGERPKLSFVKDIVPIFTKARYRGRTRP